MTIDPKAAELAKALADAVAAQQTEEYQERAKAAEENALIDAKAEAAARALESLYIRRIGMPVQDSQNVQTTTADPAHYDLPTDEFSDPKPNGGLVD